MGPARERNSHHRVRDLVIQQRETDLVVGTFGRGIFILDDYTPLRYLDTAALEAEATLLPTRDTWDVHEELRAGLQPQGVHG